MRIGWSTGVLIALLTASGVLARTESARPANGPALFLLHARDAFEVAGANVACRLVASRAPYPTRLVCFAEQKGGTYVARPGSYAVEFAQGAIAVGRIGKRGPVFERTESPPSGAPAGIDKATRPAGAHVRLAAKADRAFVAGTNIVCRAWARSPRAVLCALVGPDAYVKDGTYLAWVDARGVRVSQVQHRRSVIVFERRNGR